MPLIEQRASARAPAQRLFDLSRSIPVHLASARSSGERLVAGPTGLLTLGDEVTWEARHLGIRQRLTSRITAFSPPHYFRDSMVRGAFQRFDHDHFFEASGSSTVVVDRFDFTSPLGPLGMIADTLYLRRYMQRFLHERLTFICRIAESGEWREYLRPLAGEGVAE